MNDRTKWTGELLSGTVVVDWFACSNTFENERIASMAYVEAALAEKDREIERLQIEVGNARYLLRDVCDHQENNRKLSMINIDLRREIERLMERLQDWKDQVKAVMSEDCNGSDDRKHCTCVFPLREGIDELRKDNNNLKDLLQSVYNRVQVHQHIKSYHPIMKEIEAALEGVEEDK